MVTYGDPRGPMGTCWHLWGSMGTYRGLSGPMGTCRGFWGPMGTRGGLWGPVATSRHLSGPMGTYGRLRGPVGTYGGLWGLIGIYGDLWGPLARMGIFGGLWGAMGAHGDLSGPMGTYGGLWGPIGTYGDLWGPIGDYGDLWGFNFLHTHFETNPPPSSSNHHIYIRHITHPVVCTPKTTCHIKHETSEIIHNRDACLLPCGFDLLGCRFGATVSFRSFFNCLVLLAACSWTLIEKRPFSPQTDHEKTPRFGRRLLHHSFALIGLSNRCGRTTALTCIAYWTNQRSS